MDKKIKYKALAKACQMHNPGDKVVFGEGNLDANVMLVGEALGKDEVKQGRPFVGAAGQKLNEYLDMAGLARKDVYITNVVKKRPLDETASYPKNRAPNDKEVEKYRYYLEKELALVDPELIITLGSTPLKYFMGPSSRITRMHGTYAVKNGYCLFFLYHPAAVLYKEDLLETYERDILELREFLQEQEIEAI